MNQYLLIAEDNEDVILVASENENSVSITGFYGESFDAALAEMNTCNPDFGNLIFNDRLYLAKWDGELSGIEAHFAEGDEDNWLFCNNLRIGMMDTVDGYVIKPESVATIKANAKSIADILAERVQ